MRPRRLLLLVPVEPARAAGVESLRWNPSAVKEAGKSAICPIVALETTAVALPAP